MNKSILDLKNKNIITTSCYINGKFVSAKRNFDVINPYDNKVVASVPDMGKAETAKAIKAAEKALPQWRAKTAKERSIILRKWYELIMANVEDLAVIMTVEQGKPLEEARGEIKYAAAFIEWFAEEAKRIYGSTIPSPWHDKHITVVKEPVGVCAAITPWNFPSAMITRKVGAALAAGCTIVVKPASQTPLSALSLAKLADEAGVPAGVLNIVTGNAEIIGAELAGSNIVRKLSFTGSTAVGKKLMQQCASNVKKISLELGGNAPFIIFDDADLDKAVDDVMASKFRNSGQTCVCANRILVQDGIYDKFAKKLAVKVKQLKVGNGLEMGVAQGPLINKKAVLKVKKIIADAVGKGAKILVGGHTVDKESTLFQPTILTEVTEKMLCAREEIFGPVAALFRFKGEDEAVKMANNTEFGLASYIHSTDLAKARRVAENLEYGMVAVNQGVLSTEVAPFGGIKESGIGREGSYMGIDEYLEVKYILS